MSVEEDKTSRSGRVRKLTPKMELFMQQSRQGTANKLRLELLDKTAKTETLLSQENVTIQEIQENYDDIVVEQSRLQELEVTEVVDLDEEEKTAYAEVVGTDNSIIQTGVEVIKQFLAQSEITPNDSASQVSKAQSNTSKMSTKSNKELIIEEKTKLAEIEFERRRIIQQAALDEERRKLEELQRQLEQKEQLMKLERDMQLSKVKLEILSQVGSECGSGTSKSSKRARVPDNAEPRPKKPAVDVNFKASSPQKGYVPPKFEYSNSYKKSTDSCSYGQPDNQLTSLEGAFDKLANAIDRGSRQTLQIEPQVFNGDVLSFELWKRNFEELIERDVKPERRFIYLLRYTEGTARECIDSLTHLKSVDAYTEGMKMLTERFGDKFHSYEAIRDKLDDWTTISEGDGAAMRKFADFLGTCLTAMMSNPSLSTLNTMPEIHKLLRKLPRRIMDKWSNKVDEWQYGSKSEDRDREYPPFFIFVEFVKKQARIELGPVKRMMSKMEPLKARPVKVHMTDIDENDEVNCYATAANLESNNCICCEEAHHVVRCPKFAAMAVSDRLQFSYNKQMCRGCLNPGHFAWACKELHRCEKCQGRHHTLFHDEAFKSRNRNTRPSNRQPGGEDRDRKTVLSTRTSDDNITAHVVMVNLYSQQHPEKPIQVYAVIDNQSNACFISREAASAVCVDGQPTNVELHTMAGVEDVVLNKVEGLSVSDKQATITIAMPPTYVKDGMEIGHEQIPAPADVKRFSHLARIAQEMSAVDKTIPIGLLIGRNCYRGTKLTDFIPSPGNEPYAVKTDLGWGIVGNLQGNKSKNKSTVWVHSTSAHEPSPSKFFNDATADFQDQHQEGKLSQDDLKFIKCLDEGMVVNEDGRMMFPLPLKNNKPVPNNRSQAMSSLRGLKKKLLKDEGYKNKFVKKMEELFEKGYAEPAPKDAPEGRTFHLTFHGVFHPKKVDELRVVFNGARAFLGYVLNEMLLQGPDQINNLVGVFCRFRKELVTLTCDIEAMFYQVLVVPEDRDLLRFLWYPGGDLDAEPVEYRMMVHVFGATSSPGVAGHSLLKLAQLYEDKYGEQTAQFIKDGFYVDDGVTSTNDDDKALALMKSSRGMCAEGKFNLTKFSSNSRAVLEQIPREIQAKNLRDLDLTKDALPQGYTLGIFLCNEEDCISFQVQLKPMPRTRRGILSTVSQVYDPLGLASPFVLEGKRILQQLCKEGRGWDAPIPDEMLTLWDQWIAQIKNLENLKFPRCYSSKGVESATNVELHHFADASLKGYGQCSYLRLRYEDNTVETSLVMAKAKVLPKQAVTVPRLELAAAVLAVRTSRFLQSQLQIEGIQHHFWSDSKVVLGYINNESKRFHVYVANRVANIRESSSPEQWHHVDTEENPADLASRGTTVIELIESTLWKFGPSFLKQPDAKWTADKGTIQEEDPEVRKLETYNTEMVESAVNWEPKFQKFSTWKALTRGFAKLAQATNNAQESTGLHTVSLEERKLGETIVIKKTQNWYFKEEIRAMEKIKKNSDADLPSILKTGRLRKLDPFIDDKGIVRVGGRFKNGPWSYGLKHPIILPGESHISELLIRYIHAQVAHSGREATMSGLRASGFWILTVRRRIDSTIWKCVTCRRFRGRACKQKMGEMPEERQEEVPAFTHVGVDFFGPYAIKQGRARVKRYVVMYTCLVTRATNLDKAYGLSSDDFINSYRRFLARRGAVRTIRSDRGTNFIGAKGEIERNLDDIFDEKTRQLLTDSGCEFVQVKMNPPNASHMGGVWERPIGTGKRIINVLLHEHASMLDDDLLDTVLAETEGIMNGMPLTAVDTSGADSMKPLTPAMLLTMKPSVAPPPLHRFDSPDVYSRRRWKRAQHVADEFWKRWRLELMPKWQERKKWTAKERNLNVGDIVLMVDDDAPRMTWPMGIVTETFPGKDGLVRSVTISTQRSTYTRPVHKLLLLLERSNPVNGAL